MTRNKQVMSQYPSSHGVEFVKELQVSSKDAHGKSGHAVYVTAPIALSSKRVYRQLLANFYWVFHTMEKELEQGRHQHPKLNAIHFHQLNRTKAFEKDLEYYYGEGFREMIKTLTPMTREYVEEIRKDVKEDPIRLIAYCQTMHMAILAGGSIVKTWVERGFGKGNAQVFDMGSKEQVKALKTQYHESLNCISLTREERDRIIEKKLRVFVLNDRLFEELRTSQLYKRRIMWFFIKIIVMMMIVAILVLVKMKGFSAGR